MLITKVKVGKVTNLSEARYCAGMGVDFLSFPVSSVDPKTYQEITGWVAGPIFGVEAEAENKERIDQYNTDFIEVTIERIDLLTDKKLIVCLAASDWSKNKAKVLAVKNRVLFLELGISSVDAETNSIIEASKQFELLIKLSNPADLSQILKLPIAGISLDGIAEERPGLKEYPLSEILEQLEELD